MKIVDVIEKVFQVCTFKNWINVISKSLWHSGDHYAILETPTDVIIFDLFCYLASPSFTSRSIFTLRLWARFFGKPNQFSLKVRNHKKFKYYLLNYLWKNNRRLRKDKINFRNRISLYISVGKNMRSHVPNLHW